MVLYLSGDSAATPIDASGSGDTIEQANVTRVDSPNGRAFSFDGTDGTIQLSDAARLKLNEFTIAAFVRTNAADAMPGQEIASLGDVWGLRIRPGGDARIFAYGDQDYTRAESLGANLLDGEWHHLAASRAAGELRLFVDGAEVASIAMPDDINYEFGDDFRVGQHGLNLVYPFIGEIDEVRLFDRGLSDAEIASLSSL